jgi:glyoxylase-like metal-dependent hydrolase (beta-lactamase superfamily II)
VIDVRRVLAPNPGIFTLEGTNTWIVGRDPAAVIDPGPDLEEHLRAVAWQAGPVEAILVTHDHPDHAAGGAALARLTGAPVHAYRPAAGVRRLRDGDVIPVGGGALMALHTPGHTSDHMVFVAEVEGAVFTGDTVLGRGTAVIDPPDGDLAAYLRSLLRLEELQPDVIYPGHGPTVFAAREKLREYLEHRAEREAQVVGALAVGPATPAEIVLTVYTDVPSELHPVAERQVLANLLKLEAEGRVRRSAGSEPGRFALESPAS